MLDGVSDLHGEGRFGGRTPSQNMQLQVAAKQSFRPMLPSGEYKRGVGWMDLPQRFRLLPNDFGLCYMIAVAKQRADG